MGRGGKEQIGHRGSKGPVRRDVRGSRNGPWDPINQEDDPLRDLRAHEDDHLDPINDEYVWPEFHDEDED